MSISEKSIVSQISSTNFLQPNQFEGSDKFLQPAVYEIRILGNFKGFGPNVVLKNEFGPHFGLITKPILKIVLKAFLRVIRVTCIIHLLSKIAILMNIFELSYLSLCGHNHPKNVNYITLLLLETELINVLVQRKNNLWCCLSSSNAIKNIFSIDSIVF